MGICSIENCENECFEQEDKCILHCEKNDWFEITDEKKDWSKSEEKIRLFWQCIQSDLNERYNHDNFGEDIGYKCSCINVIFPRFEREYEDDSQADNIEKLGTNFYSFGSFSYPGEEPNPEINKIIEKLEISFKNCIFLDKADFEKYLFKRDIVFSKCTFEDEIKLNKQQKSRISFLACPEIESLNFSRTIFEQKVEIKECTINSCDFANTRLEKVCDFYRTHFYEVNFDKTTFEGIAVFTESKFHKDINFKYTTFEKLALFRKTTFEKTVNFEDSIFKEEANFLDITANMANRETARIIKNSFEQQNNTIEANRFYALEMKKREEELTKKLPKSFLEWIIFKIHGISSDHSQSWFLALFWIVLISLFYTANIQDNFIDTVFATYYSDMLDNIANAVNPFSIMTSKDPMTFDLLMFKITITYLFYQFVVSVRQNTRRK